MRAVTTCTLTECFDTFTVIKNKKSHILQYWTFEFPCEAPVQMHFLTHVRLSPSDGRCFQVVFYDCCDVEVCQMNVTCMKRHRICFYTFTFGNPINPEMTQSCRITELRLHLKDWQKLFLFLGFIKFKDILHRSGILLCMLLMWVWDMQRPGSKEF